MPSLPGELVRWQCVRVQYVSKQRPHLGVQRQKRSAIGNASQEYVLLPTLDIAMTNDSDRDDLLGEAAEFTIFARSIDYIVPSYTRF